MESNYHSIKVERNDIDDSSLLINNKLQETEDMTRSVEQSYEKTFDSAMGTLIE